MTILGIESSCDETSVAIIKALKGRFFVLSNEVASQVKIHARTFGVVPEVAARTHAQKIVFVLDQALKKAHQLLEGKNQSFDPLLFCKKYLDLIAVTQGPGLVTSLLVGLQTAKTLSLICQKPVVGVNHLAGHIYANWLQEESEKIAFPVLCLIASGGHTLLVLMKNHLNYQIIGQTLDDAAGECLDKIARMLGLPYPGGPAIARLANHNLPEKIIFPKPMINSPDFNFSFSGLKTAVLYFLQKQKKLTQQKQQEIATAVESAVVETLVVKTRQAILTFQPKTLLLGGGVTSNSYLRLKIKELTATIPNLNFIALKKEYALDNAAMIAAAGYFLAQTKKFSSIRKLNPNPNLPL